MEALREEPRTMVFYEAPHKLISTLRDMADAWGDRRISLVRELTKIHEEIVRTTLFQAVEQFADGHAKGEFVLIVEGAKPAPSQQLSPEDGAARARGWMEQGLSASEAAKRAAMEFGLRKGDIYKLLIKNLD